MEDEVNDILFHSSTNSLSTCIANESLEKEESQGSSKDTDVLFKVQDTTDDINAYENCAGSVEPFCRINLESIFKLKESTKQLLCLLEEIGTKTYTKNIIPDESPNFTNVIRPQNYTNTSVLQALGKLEMHAKNLDAIFIQNEHDSCSVYSKLTRRCNCLNQPNYNDLVIHFNEESKYTTSTLGEIIKNMCILRKFLYMGGSYTKNALMFLNEGMMESSRMENVEVTQACAHADVCNLFDDHSIVIICISWPCKNKYYGDYVTQALAAGFLYKLAELEEGRRYLNYSSKIINDIRKVLRKRSTCIEIDIIDSLNATLNLLQPVFAKNVDIAYFNRSGYEGVGKKTINDLVRHRQYMTLNEVLMHLELLNNYSDYEVGKKEMILQLPLLLILFKHLLVEYDNSEINISVTNILNNVISKKMVNDKNPETSKSLALADTFTEAIRMKNAVCQIPSKRAIAKKIIKNKCDLGVSPNFHQRSKRKDQLKKSIIIVPIEK